MLNYLKDLFIGSFNRENSHFQEIVEGHFKCFCQSIQRAQGRINFSPLNSADLTDRNICFVRQAFLGKAMTRTQIPDVHSKSPEQLSVSDTDHGRNLMKAVKYYKRIDALLKIYN